MACVVACCTLTPHPLSAESLWDRHVPGKAFLFYDTQARFIGDLLTIVINENVDVQNREDRALSKEAEAAKSWQLETMTGGDFGARSAEAEFDFDANSERSFDGSASFRSEQEFTTRVTVSVVDVLPNGNLVVNGHREVFVAGDARVLRISGIVRPFDVSPDNTVQSRFVANFRMAYDGLGPDQRYTRRGWLGRTIDFIWPD